MPYTPIYLTLAEATSATSKISWCWSDDNGTFTSQYLRDDLEAIEGEVSGYLSVRYSLPITEAVALSVVKGYIVVLLRSRGYNRHPVAATPESVLQESRQVRGQLRDISSGGMLLGDAPQRTTGTRTVNLGGVYDEARFTRTKLSGWG